MKNLAPWPASPQGTSSIAMGPRIAFYSLMPMSPPVPGRVSLPSMVNEGRAGIKRVFIVLGKEAERPAMTGES